MLARITRSVAFVIPACRRSLVAALAMPHPMTRPASVMRIAARAGDHSRGHALHMTNASQSNGRGSHVFSSASFMLVSIFEQ